MKRTPYNWIRPSLTRNVILYVVLMSIVPLITLGAISYWVSRSAVHEQVQRYTMEIMTEKKNYLNLLMRNVESLMLSLAGQEDIRQVLQDQVARRNRVDDFERLSTQAKIGYILSEYVNLDGILSIDLFSTGGVHYHVGETLVRGKIRKSIQEQLYSDAIQSQRPVTWAGMVDSILVSSQHPKVIAAVKVIQTLDAETGEKHPIGFLAVSYDPDVFHQKFHHKGQIGQIFRVVDQRDQIVCDPDMKKVGKTLDPLLKNRMNAQTGLFHAEMDGRDTLVFYDRSEDTGWVLMSFIQTARIDEQIDVIAGNALWATGISTVLAVLFILHFSRRVVSPIRDITARFKEIRAGRPESELHLTATSRDEIGELVRWFNTFLNNQTEKRRTEEELIQSQAQLRRSHEVLEKRVAERTRELIEVNQALRNEITERKHAENQRQELEAQLRQSQKMEAIGTLAGGIAHDFNNILSPIMGYTELILSEVEKGSQIETRLQAVYTAGKRARDLVKQILVVARKTETEKKPLQVSIVIKEALKLLRASIPASIEIVQRIESDSLIMGDFTHIHQIVINLCTNALHAMEDSSGRLTINLSDIRSDILMGHKTVSAGITDKPGEFIRLTIADTGSGIAPDILEKIFMPYFTTKDIDKGTGMGLAIVQGIVQSYGGSISVESELGKGTIFTIDLPVIQECSENIAHIQEALPSGTEHILIIDDEPQIADMEKLMLNTLGYRVTIRNSSPEALAFIKSGSDMVDLVLTDLTMPHMSGEQLAVEMMKIRPTLPIILSTGYSRQISNETIAKTGIRALLLKPVAMRDLAHTVRKVLDEVNGSTS